ncbi:MAG: CPBP family intramembrane glutamic endopeptidase [Cyclobacteriaceae bacterium]
MENYTDKSPLTGRINPFLGIVSILFIAFGFYIVLSFISLLLVEPLFNTSSVEIAEVISGNVIEIEESTRQALFFIQGISALGAFIFAPLFYIFFIEQKNTKVLLGNQQFTFLTVVLTTVITISFMPVNSIIAEWNMGAEFPDFMEGWARQQEDAARAATEALTNITSPGYLLVSFLIIAIIPAIGEELLFRGILQNKLWEASNIHLAIWITGIIFGVIHLQFYGVIPRIILGVIFGYLYYWSATLWVPIIAHFVNNGFTLLLLYMNNTGQLNYDIEDQEMPYSTVIPFTIIFVAAMIYFYRYMEQKKNERLA